MREALSLANGSIGIDTITFSASLAGDTILLDEELKIVEGVTIDGGNQITLDAGNGVDGIFATGDGFRIFNIDDDDSNEIDVTLRGLTLTGGDAGVDEFGAGLPGGAILSRENLEIIDSSVVGNAAGKVLSKVTNLPILDATAEMVGEFGSLAHLHSPAAR